MKFLIISLIIISTLSCRTAKQQPVVRIPNAIDTLETTADVQAFVKQVNLYIRGTWETPHIPDTLSPTDKPCKGLFDSIQTRSWYKEDFDGNGTTDLLVTGDLKYVVNKDTLYNKLYETYCILDTGKNNFTIRYLDLKGNKYEDNCCFYSVYKDTGSTGLINHSYIRWNHMGAFIPVSDTLVYKFGDFIELNKTPTRHTFGAISYENSDDYSYFRLIIRPDRRAEFSDGGVTGNVTTIDPLSYKRIIDILNYINLDGYKNGSPGQERQMLEVTYNEHNSAWIYGTYGSRALRLLYAELEKLKVTQKWERSY